MPAAKGKGKGGKDDWGSFMEGIMMAMKGGGKGKMGPTAGPARNFDNVEVVADNLVGIIKSFNPLSGYGFIENAEVKAQYGGDAFLHHGQVEEFGIGDQVVFAVFINESGKPQAKNLRAPGA